MNITLGCVDWAQKRLKSDNSLRNWFQKLIFNQYKNTFFGISIVFRSHDSNSPNNPNYTTRLTVQHIRLFLVIPLTPFERIQEGYA